MDGVPTQKITAFLFKNGGNEDPTRLRENANISFNGCAIAGVGFTFDDGELRATPLSEADRLIERDPRNAALIHPFVGGDDINGSPILEPSRKIICFKGMSLEEAGNWPDLLEIVRQKVKPERDLANRPAHRSRWWQFGDWRPGLFRATEPLDRMLCVVFISQYSAFVWLPTNYVISHNLGIFATESDAFFSVVQCRVHEYFATDLSSGLEDRPGYRPSDGFEPFPFPENWKSNADLLSIGETYYAKRSAIMASRNEGLTRIYNHFHSRLEVGGDIEELRRLHAQMDSAVLRAYGWHDLAERGAPKFIEQEADEGKTPKTRLDWPSEFKDEVLARLLALNAERAAADHAAGLSPTSESDEDRDEDRIDADLTGPLL